MFNKLNDYFVLAHQNLALVQIAQRINDEFKPELRCIHNNDNANPNVLHVRVWLNATSRLGGDDPDAMQTDQKEKDDVVCVWS